MRLPGWNLLVAFESVARHGSFSRAAQELNVLQPAVSRRVGLLEKELGVDLLKRTRPSVTLTAEGQVLFRAVSGSISQVQLAVQQIRSTSKQPTLAVGTTIGFANCFLMRRLSGFRKQNPEIPIELISRDMNDGYNTESCDVITVFDNPGRLPGISHTRIFEERMIAVCAPAYLERFPLTGGNFADHRLLHLPFGIHGEDWNDYLDGIGQALPPADASQRYTSFMVYLQAAINGEGIAIGWSPLLDDLLDSGVLVKVIDHEMVTDRGYFCCITERGRRRDEAELFARWCGSLAA